MNSPIARQANAPLLVMAVLAAAAAPAAASTVPRVDLTRGQTSAAFGLYDLDLDHLVTDRLAIGLNTNVISLAARLTYRLGGTPGGACWGVGLAAGPALYIGSDAFGVPANPTVPTQTLLSGFIQPAFVWSVPLSPAVTFRGTLGPVLAARLSQQGASYRFIESELIPLWPNLELAIRWGPGELTLGGGVFGYRWTF